MPFRATSFAAAVALLLSVSCSDGGPGYSDHVRLLSDDKAHPLLLELLPLFQKPQGRNPDDLVRTWKEFLGDTPVPLRKDSTVTFVYYDFSGTRSQIWLEASFAPHRREPLTKVPSVGLFYKVYDVPLVDRLRYRFTDGSTPLLDPFNSRVDVTDESWHAAPDGSHATERALVGASLPALGRDLRVVLPPLYERNLAQTYPLVMISGLDGWTQAAARILDSGAAQPFIAVPQLDDGAQLWVAAHFRTISAPPFSWQGNDAAALETALKTQFPVENP